MWFLWQQLVVLPWRQLRRLPTRRRLQFFLVCLRRSRRCLAFLAEAYLMEPELRSGFAGFVVILLSFNRPWNIDPMARVLLKSTSVEKVIVCNNNPRWRAEKVVRVRHRRLVLMDRCSLTKPGYRFEVARGYSTSSYLAIDDDTFLTRKQIRILLDGFLDAAESPCGTRGSIFTGPDKMNEIVIERTRDWPFRLAGCNDAAVDILNAVYAFGQGHLERYFQLCKILSIRDQASFDNGEDIVMSHCGVSRPRRIEVGPCLRCLSSGMPGIAISATNRLSFFSERWRIFQALRSERVATLCPWVPGGRENAGTP